MPEMLFRFVLMEVDDSQRERKTGREKGKKHNMWSNKTQEADLV